MALKATKLSKNLSPNIIKSAALCAILGLSFFLSGITVYAQERVKPSKGYLAGDTILSPLYGIKLVLPDHWNGFLTRGTEVFTLSPDTTGETSIMIFPSEENLKTIETRWNGHVELSPGVDVLPVEPPKIKNGKLQSEFAFSGNENRMGFSIAQCGDFGFCYTAFLIVNKATGSNYRNTLDQLSDYVSFFEPTITEYYGDYDWAQQLKTKYLITYESGGGSTKQNHLWLCEDGTFQSKITRKGGLKGTTGKYKGKLNGTYTITGVGSSGKILLNFEKLSPLELPLEIKDEVIFMNELRYSMAEHNQCK